MIVQAIPYPAPAPLDLANYFANIGATGPFYSNATFPAAFQDSTGKTRLFFGAWSGARRMLRTVPYDHSTGTFGQFRGIAIGVLTDDEHGIPAACEDADGYLHVAGNSHATDLLSYRSESAISVNSNPTFRLEHTFSGAYSYPHWVAVGTGLYLFCRDDTTSTQRTGAYFKTSALSAGVPTWVAKKTIVDFGSDSRCYFGSILLVGTDIHIVATRADADDTARKGVYYFILDTTTGDISNFDGGTTVANASLPVGITTANSSFRIVDHGTNRGDIPYLAFDTDGNPHIAYVDGSGTSFSFKHIMHDGTSWTSATTIGSITGVTGASETGAVGTCAIIPKASGVMDFHYPDNSGGMYRGEAGDWKKRSRSAGGVFSSESTILTAGTAKIGRMTGPIDAHADLRVFATELAASADDADAGGLRIYGYGDSGLIGPATISLDSAATSIISAFATEPSVERKLAINDLVVKLKGTTIWNKLDALYLLAAHESAAAKINWKNPGTYNLTTSGAPTFSTNSGYSTDGVDDYLDTNFNPATAGGSYAQNSACFGIWSASSGQSTPSVAGWFDGTDGVSVIPRSTTNAITGRINQAATSIANASITDGTGFVAMNRSGASALQFYKNGSAVTINTNPTQASTALNSATLKLGSITASSFAAFAFRAAVIGGSLTSTEQSDLYNFILEYLRQVGAET